MEKRIDRVIFTCGGTAGHVNPAIAVAQLMAEKNPDVKILFVGAERGLEKDLIPKAGYDFRTVHISSFHRLGVSCERTVPGVQQRRRLHRRHARQQCSALRQV